jgi:hypothetical protein
MRMARVLFNFFAFLPSQEIVYGIAGNIYEFLSLVLDWPIYINNEDEFWIFIKFNGFDVGFANFFRLY